MDRLIVVPVSGGKDSQACLKLAVQQSDAEVVGLFNDTGWEHPDTYRHVDKLSALYGVKIYITKSVSVPDIVKSKRNFPGMRARECTKQLKIRPSNRWYQDFAGSHGGFEAWIGIRKSESVNRARRYKGMVGDEIYPPHEFMTEFPKKLQKMGVMFRLPIIDWSEEDVFEFLGGEQNPLYGRGHARVGCFPCLAGSDKQKRQCFDDGEFGRGQLEIVSALEVVVGRSVFRDGPVSDCSLCSI